MDPRRRDTKVSSLTSLSKLPSEPPYYWSVPVADEIEEEKADKPKNLLAAHQALSEDLATLSVPKMIPPPKLPLVDPVSLPSPHPPSTTCWAPSLVVDKCLLHPKRNLNLKLETSPFGKTDSRLKMVLYTDTMILKTRIYSKLSNLVKHPDLSLMSNIINLSRLSLLKGLMNLIELLPRLPSHLKVVEIDWDRLLLRLAEVEVEVLPLVLLDPVRLGRLQSQPRSRSTPASLLHPSSSGWAMVPSESAFSWGRICANDTGSSQRSTSPIPLVT
jgi:hypothetical protein